MSRSPTTCRWACADERLRESGAVAGLCAVLMLHGNAGPRGAVRSGACRRERLTCTACSYLGRPCACNSVAVHGLPVAVLEDTMCTERPCYGRRRSVAR